MRKVWCFAVTVILLTAFSMGLMAQKSVVTRTETASGPETKVEEPEEDRGPVFLSNRLIDGMSYPLTVLAGVGLEDMSSGTTQIINPGVDDTASPVTDIGFDFWFDGVRATQFSCNANGLCRLGPVIVTTTFSNSLATVTAAPKIAPFWDDLCVGNDGKVHYKVVGDAPNRKLVVEFLNMKITRDGTCVGAMGNGSFQLWLHETSGVIQFVYGNIPATTADAGYSVGMQSGVATNFASITTNGGTVSYDTANNTQMDAIPAGTSYAFTPNVPAPPSAVNFTEVTAVSLNVNWTDNATNEVAYLVERSTDGVNFAVVAELPANSSAFADSGLAASTTYTYRVAAISEGAVSGFASGSQATNAPGMINTVGAGGLWSNSATWSTGTVPTPSDIVTIANGATVTIDTAAEAYRVVVTPVPVLADSKLGGVQGTLIFEDSTARSLAIQENLVINVDGIFATPNSGTVTTHSVSVAGSIINGGTLDLSTNADTAGAGITFSGPNDAVFTGTGPTTDVRTITMNKGSGRDAVVELMTTNFTVGGSDTDTALGNFLTLTNGTFKVSGTFNGSYRTFAGAVSYSIAANGGFWLNNPNYTVVGQTGNATNNGRLRISQGTFNVGTAIDNTLGGGANSDWIIEGGTINATGRVQSASAVNYEQTGGTINACTVGTTSTLACFGFTSTLSSFNMSGGVINLVQVSSGATVTSRRAYSVNTNSVFTGGTVNVGTAETTGTAGDFEFRVLGNAPNIVVDGTTNGKTLTLAGTLNVFGDIMVNPGGSINIHNGSTAQTLQFRGGTITNNGSINGGVAAASRLNFLGPDPQSYGGSGTWGTPETPASGFGISTEVTANAPIITNRVNLFGGLMINSSMIMLGNGGTSSTVVQTSQTGSLVDGGTFDVSPVYNTGTGGHTILYIEQPGLRTAGFEIPPSRTANAVTFNLPSDYVLTGGGLTVTGTLTLTAGSVFTGANTLTHNGTVTRTDGVVEGNLSRSFSVAGAYTYHVGQNGYSPMIANVTAGTFPSSLTVSVTDDFLPGLAQNVAVSRFWSLTETGDLTGDLTFTYTDDDVNGTEENYKVFRRTGGVTSEVMPSTVNPAANTASVTGITDFSDWGIGESLAPPTAQAVVSGKVTGSNGPGIPNIVLVLTGPGDFARMTVTNSFGNYRFEGVPTGATYTLTVSGKYQFNPPSRMFFLGDDITDADFEALEHGASLNAQSLDFTRKETDGY